MQRMLCPSLPHRCDALCSPQHHWRKPRFDSGRAGCVLKSKAGLVKDLANTWPNGPKMVALSWRSAGHQTVQAWARPASGKRPRPGSAAPASRGGGAVPVRVRPQSAQRPGMLGLHRGTLQQCWHSVHACLKDRI